MLKRVRLLFYSILFLFLLDLFDVFQTKISFLKSLVYYGVLIVPILLLILEFKAMHRRRESFLRKAIPIVTVAGLLFLNPLKILANTATWKTQTIILIHENRPNHKVEFQMKDIGAFGYRKRTCEVLYFSKYFYLVWAKNYDDSNFNGQQWKKVNRTVNEMELK